ncbi:MAG: beta-ketoacyl synthase [Bacteroidaceae bacterium]|nr:beta-ketoacyl synthase [Bacteroidaceae bacterium]
MIQCIADNVVSPLGLTSADNYAGVKAGRSGLARYEEMGNVCSPFMLSRIDRDVIDRLCKDLGIPEGYTFFEKLLLCSSVQAVRQSGIDASSERVLFIISTTKGNVALLDSRITSFPRERVLLGESARLVARYFGNPNTPIVVCNACISGVCAQIEAMRALRSGRYDYAVVIGADEQSPFIISGFLSFKALTDTPCRPFDKDRTGLNLGECAATVVLKAVDDSVTDGWVLECGAIRNDSNHISGPSRTGEGSYLALMEVLKECGREGLAFLNVHGTATAYNDEMESIAIYRAGLIDVPVTGLKGYYGHTMGAAGIMESILSMYAVQDGTVLATRGYTEQGVTYPVSVSPENRPAQGNSFIKLLSGFGGCNAALAYRYYKS